MTYNLDYTKTADLLAAYKQEKRPTTFLQDRYFPDAKVFNADEILVEYKKGNEVLAPFVSPRINGKTMRRDGYKVRAYEPGTIAPKRALTLDTLEKKGFGEAYYSQLTKAERAAKIAAEDMVELSDMIARRREAMSAEIFETNSLVMNHYTDDNTLTESKTIDFYEGSNPALYTPKISWDQADALILEDIEAMADSLNNEGLPAVDVLLGTNAYNAFRKNEKILKLLDNRRVELGSVKPGPIGDNAFLVAALNIGGTEFNFIHYKGTYVNDEGVRTKYINPNKVIVTAPGCGETNYAAVTQINYGDANFTTHAEKEVPLFEVKDQTRSLILKSRPLPQPKNEAPFRTATAIFG